MYVILNSEGEAVSRTLRKSMRRAHEAWRGAPCTRIKSQVCFFHPPQTLLFALTPADDSCKSFMQKQRPLGTWQKVLSRYKVNKQPKRQRLWES